jgi:Protein of unknown function (DUF1194)
MGRWYAIHVPDGLHTPVERGITINGLPILLKRPSPATMDIEDLDIYYEDCVIARRLRDSDPGARPVSARRRAPSWSRRPQAAKLRRALSRPPTGSRAFPAPSGSRCGSSAEAGWISAKHQDALSPSGRDWAVLKPEIAPGTDLKLQGSTSTKPTRPAVLPLK